MGKIHKALEKSKNERKDKSKSGSVATSGTRIVPKENTGQGASGRKRDYDEPVPVSQGFDLGTIHELLHESAEAGVPKFSDKNDTTPNDNQDASILKKAPSVALPSADNPKLSDEKIEEVITTDLDFGQKDSFKKPSDAKVALDTQNFIPTDVPLTKSDMPGSGGKSSLSTKPVSGQKYHSLNKQKSAVLTPKEISDKKIFVLREKTLDEFARKEIPDKTVTDYVHKNDSADFDSDLTSYSTVDNSLIALLKPRSYEAEQFKILRTNLLFPESGKPARTILITSAAPGEGKSFVSSNLAVSLALDYDRKVLLIDADVRRSRIDKIFGLNSLDKGICDFLTDRIPLTSLLVKTSLKNLIILPAGKLMRNPAELQSLEKLPKLFEELAAHFGEYFIVIDSPPPKLASETGVLARLVDSIVIVIKAGVTKREYVEETIDLLEKGKIAGIVFNWHDSRMSNYKKYAKNREYYS